MDSNVVILLEKSWDSTLLPSRVILNQQQSRLETFEVESTDYMPFCPFDINRHKIHGLSDWE